MKKNTDKEVTVLFTLLKAGLWEKEPENLSLFPLSANSWEYVYRLARQQTVTAIVYQGICKLPERLLPPESLLFRWVAEADSIERKNRRMNRTLEELYRLFRENGLNPVLQKGQGIALLYENPLVRECGDIDFYFQTAQEGDCAFELIKRLGKAMRQEADGSRCYVWKGIEVEHHPRLLDIANPFVQPYLKKLEVSQGYRTACIASGHDFEIRVPSPMLNLLLLNTHIMKHSFGWGIGLRQFCDMARAYHCLSDVITGSELKTLYRKTGILRWSRLLHSFLTEHIGLDATRLPYQEKPLCVRALQEMVLQGGNFGQHLIGRSHASQPFWKRKAHTSYSFLRHARFSLTYAPKEALWTFTSLLAGQPTNKKLF